MNNNLLNRLKPIKDLWEAKNIYEQTTNQLQYQYDNLGIEPFCYNAQQEHYGIIEFLCTFFCFGMPLGVFFGYLGYGLSILIIDIFSFTNDKIAQIIAFILAVLPSLIIPICQKVKIVKNYKKKQKEIDEWRKSVKEKAQYEKDFLKPPIKNEIEFYKNQLSQIDSKLNYCYNILCKIPEDYRSYNAAMLFYDYVKSGRCDSIKECMLKFDNDSEIAKMNEKINLMYAKLEELCKTTIYELDFLRRSIKNDIDKTNNLLKLSYSQNEQQLKQLSYNIFVHELLTQDFVDELKNSG